MRTPFMKILSTVSVDIKKGGYFVMYSVVKSLYATRAITLKINQD
jgi:hypothetical protein